jgi:hypothetical protein
MRYLSLPAVAAVAIAARPGLASARIRARIFLLSAEERKKMKRYLAVLFALLATSVPIAATASSATASASAVRLVRVTSPISHGSYATLVAHVSPSNVICSIAVYYKSGKSTAAGLRPLRRPVAGRVSWTWKVGTRTTPGRWPIYVRCGSAGTLRTSFRVT